MESCEKKSGDEDPVMDGHRNSRPIVPLCAANRADDWCVRVGLSVCDWFSAGVIPDLSLIPAGRA